MSVKCSDIMSDQNVKLAGHIQNLVGQCPMPTVMHLSIETPTPGKYGALMGVTKGFSTFLCPRGWGIYCFLLHPFCPWGGD